MKQLQLDKKVAIIGGGPAGLMAAGKAGQRRLDTTVFEKNNALCKKLLITGKGRCNITNNIDVEGLIDNIPGNGSFLYSSFYTFSNKDIIDFFENNGLKTKVERGGRVFPVSDDANDVASILSNYAKSNNVKVLFGTSLKEIITEKGSVKGLLLNNDKIFNCNSIVLATGGASYPRTGSTGDGYAIAKHLGHTIISPKPSLVPLEIQEEWIRELQGLSLRNVSVTFTDKKGKKLYSDFGEMLFTHFGVSGPVILSGSSHILSCNSKECKLTIDLKPALSEEKLYERVSRDFDLNSRKMFKNALDDLLPQKLISVIIKLSDILPEKAVNQITREEKRRLTMLLKNLKLTVKGTRPISEAIVTSGGIATDEIDPSTMESKIIKGLYFAGEIIDVDGYTGGFNLTIAFSTGYMAGSNC